MSERIGRYEIIEAGVETTPAEDPKRPIDAVWGRRWTLRDDGARYAITFEASLGFGDAMDAGLVSDSVRRVFATNGRTAVEEDYAQREPSKLPTRVELKPTELEESDS